MEYPKVATSVLTSGRMKSDRDRGVIGAWARRQRLARNWTTADVVAALRKREVNILEATYRGIEAGPRPPSADVQNGLSAVFDSPLPDVDTEIEATEPFQLSGLIAALAEQTAAINRLVDYLASRNLEDEADEAVLAAAEDEEQPEQDGDDDPAEEDAQVQGRE
jgi:transcriptional regulator with XRE-family HTH domain